MAIGGLTGNAGFGGRSSQIGGGNNPGGGTKRQRKQALPPPSSLTSRPVGDRNKGPLQKAIESILPSGDSPGFALGMMPQIGNFLRQQATRAGLSVGPSTPGLGTGQDNEDAMRLLGEPALPAGDMPVTSPEDDMEQTNLAPSRTRLTLPNIRRRRLQSATFFG